MGSRKSRRSVSEGSFVFGHSQVPYGIQQFEELAYQEHLRNLRKLLHAQHEEIVDQTDMKSHMLPLARIKKIMRDDDSVRMISAEVPAVLGKACELLVIELSHLAWLHTEEVKRRTLHRADLAEAISRHELFDFLLELVPKQSRAHYD